MRALPATTTTTITSAPLPPHEVGAAVPLDEHPQYRYAGDGRFLPANNEAREECRRWNAYAAVWNARTARQSVAPERRAMTPDRTAPPSPSPAYTPAWALYIYCRRGYLTYDGRLIARAVCLTPDQEARLEALCERLTRRARDRSDPS